MKLQIVCCLSALVIPTINGLFTEGTHEGSGDEAHQGEVFDHNKPHCSDVSTWTKVKWIDKTRRKCITTFDKRPVHKHKQVCADVTELDCEIVPCEKCELKMKPVRHKETKEVIKDYNPWVCEMIPVTLTHRKLLPVCRNETKQNCVTKWKKDENGKPVWAGTEDCENVTWKKCVLEPKDVKFTTMKTKCKREGNICWKDCEEEVKTRMIIEYKCKVEPEISCQPTVKPKCKTHHWTEWVEKPIEKCTNVWISMPNQTYEHKEKCLVHDNEHSDQNKPLYGNSNHPHQSRHDQGHHDESQHDQSQHGQSHHGQIQHDQSQHGQSHQGQIQHDQSHHDHHHHQDQHTNIIDKSYPHPAHQVVLPVHPSIDGIALQGGVKKLKASELSPVYAIPASTTIINPNVVDSNQFG